MNNLLIALNVTSVRLYTGKSNEWESQETWEPSEVRFELPHMMDTLKSKWGLVFSLWTGTGLVPCQHYCEHFSLFSVRSQAGSLQGHDPLTISHALQVGHVKSRPLNWQLGAVSLTRRWTVHWSHLIHLDVTKTRFGTVFWQRTKTSTPSTGSLSKYF